MPSSTSSNHCNIPIVYRLKLARDRYSPYRRPLREEKDNVPIRLQPFPLHTPLRGPSSRSRQLSLDIIPIHRQLFSSQESGTETVSGTFENPQERAVSTSLETLIPPDTQAQSSAHTGSNSPLLGSNFRLIHNEYLPGVNGVSSPQPGSAQRLAVGSSHNPPQQLQRKERKIRDQPHYVRWFPSTGDRRLSHPSPCAYSDVGDLYVHHFPGGCQIWIRGDVDSWMSIEAGHPHPSLADYRLKLLGNGEPGWVTKKTISTYKSKKPTG